MNIIEKINKFITKTIVMAEPEDSWYENHTDDKMMSSKKRKNKKGYKIKLKEQDGDISSECFDGRCKR